MIQHEDFHTHPSFRNAFTDRNILMVTISVVRSSGRKRELHSLCLRHLVQQGLSYRLLLHLHRDAISGIVAFHIVELSLIGGHAHHSFLPIQDRARGGRYCKGSTDTVCWLMIFWLCVKTCTVITIKVKSPIPLRDGCWTATFLFCFTFRNKKILIALFMFGFLFDSDHIADECTAFWKLIPKMQILRFQRFFLSIYI